MLAGVILELLALTPTVFPLLVQLDNCNRLNNSSGLPMVRWPLWVAGSILLGVYFASQRNGLVVLPLIHHLSALLGVACWAQELLISKTKTREAVIRFCTTVVGVIIAAEVGCFAALNASFKPQIIDMLRDVIGGAGTLMFLASLAVLPYDRDFNLDGPAGGFQPIPLTVHLAGNLVTFITLMLLYIDVDFYGSALYGCIIVGEVGTIALHAILRHKAKSATREYQAIALQNLSTADR
jgi:hypothetical protein